jgi:signal transduction histidine kinase
MRVATRGELQLMANKADLVIERIHKEGLDIMYDPKLLTEMYNINEMLRIVVDGDKIINQVGYDKELLELPIAATSPLKSESLQLNGQRIVFLTVPFYYDGEFIGTVEGARRLTLLDSYIQILVSVLVATSIGAIVVTIFGTYWFTSRMTGPISQMVHTMREIDRSGKLRKVSVSDREESVELQQLVRAFNEMIDRLDRTIEHQKQFVADASHELKTPLTVISSYTDMLKRWGRDNEAVRDEAIEAISMETARLQNLIRSMLTLAEAEQDEWLQMDKFDVVTVVRELAETLGIAFKRAIRVHSSHSAIQMKGDKEKIRQMLLIFLDNALKYSKEPIDVRIRQDKSSVKLEVSDYGIGIPENEIPFLFERFYRVDTARHRQTGGSGLGLSIAKRIIDLHGGSVDVFSKLGSGTTISIKLPRH